TITGRKLTKARSGMTVVRAFLEDQHGARLGVVWFNQAWLEKQLFPGQRIIVTGKVKEVDAKGATIELADGIEGYVAARDISKERVEDASKVLKVGDEVEARFIGMDRKGRTMQLSIKAKDEAEMQEAVSDYNRSTSAEAASGTTKLGALLREQLGNKPE
ncbi:MAG: S1 RNA-binding domain-containing protein, partial [Proteobacteria bacterium]|nr:S1 RNA-binding domain-containing protein [Pseudomonadota bacterium]